MVVFKKIALHRVWYRPRFHPIVGQVIELPDYRVKFGNRVRSLREAANLSIERASEQGGVSPTFWGSVERADQEPCLNIIFGFAKGVGVSARTLVTFEHEDIDDEVRKELNSLLDLFTPSQLRLALDLARSVYNYKPAPRTGSIEIQR